jgi:hypothetical protein
MCIPDPMKKEVNMVETKNEKQITWLPVSMQLKCEFVVVFQKRIHRSAVPPPDARSPWTWGDHAIAFTAAVCSEYLSTGWFEFWFQTKSYTYVTQTVSQECRKTEQIPVKCNQSEKKKKWKCHHILYYHCRRMLIHDYHKTTLIRKPKNQSSDL